MIRVRLGKEIRDLVLDQITDTERLPVGGYLYAMNRAHCLATGLWAFQHQHDEKMLAVCTGDAGVVIVNFDSW